MVGFPHRSSHCDAWKPLRAANARTRTDKLSDLFPAVPALLGSIRFLAQLVSDLDIQTF